MRLLLSALILVTAPHAWAARTCFEILVQLYGDRAIALPADAERHLIDDVFYPPNRRHIPIPKDEMDDMLYSFSGGNPKVIPIYQRELDEYRRLMKRVGFDPERFRGKKYLDIGCGLSPVVKELHAKFDVDSLGVDTLFHAEFQSLRPESEKFVDKSLLEPHRLKKRRVMGGSMTNLPVEDSSQDVVSSVMGVAYMEHFSAQQVLAEMLRVLKVGGRGYIMNDDTRGWIPKNESDVILEALNQWGVPFYFADREPNTIVFEKPISYTVRAIPRFKEQRDFPDYQTFSAYGNSNTARWTGLRSLKP